MCPSNAVVVVVVVFEDVYFVFMHVVVVVVVVVVNVYFIFVGVVVVVVDVIVDVAVVMERYSYRTLEVMIRTMAVVTSAR